MWMTIAQQHDDWFCENFIDMPQNLPGDMPREEAIQLIKTEILGVDNVKLFKVFVQNLIILIPESTNFANFILYKLNPNV